MSLHLYFRMTKIYLDYAVRFHNVLQELDLKIFEGMKEILDANFRKPSRTLIVLVLDENVVIITCKCEFSSSAIEV